MVPLCASGWLQAKSWRVPKPEFVGLAAVRRLTPYDSLANRLRSTDLVLGV
jgi:hypothetical protein